MKKLIDGSETNAYIESEWHKGFYGDIDPESSLRNIEYEDFFKCSNDDEFPYTNAHDLLCGSCQYFALSLKKVLGYTPYVIENKKGYGYHAFCKIHQSGKCFYVDARGITASFSEFMNIAKKFVQEEYVIRQINASDIEKWENDDDFKEEGYGFAEAIIKKFREYYTLP